MAISGASQLFTIIWSSTVPSERGIVLAQRWRIIIGVGSVLVGVGFDFRGLVWFGGTAAISGLVIFGWVIYTAVRRSLLRRFDPSARFYLTAFAAGALGIRLGTLMGAGAISRGFSTSRLVHAHLNLVGLVGLTIIGTIPTLLPTTAYSPGRLWQGRLSSPGGCHSLGSQASLSGCGFLEWWGSGRSPSRRPGS